MPIWAAPGTKGTCLHEDNENTSAASPLKPLEPVVHVVYLSEEIFTKFRAGMLEETGFPGDFYHKTEGDRENNISFDCNDVGDCKYGHSPELVCKCNMP